MLISNENDSHNSMFTMQMRWGGNSVHVNKVATLTAWSNLPSTKTMETSMLWPMTRVYSHFSGCDTVGCRQRLNNICVNNVQMVRHWWHRPVAFGDDGTDISKVVSQLDTSPSATFTASLNNMASTSSHFQGTGYGTSSSSVRILFILGPLFCESVFDGLCSSIVHSLPDSPFSLVSPSLHPTIIS